MLSCRCVRYLEQSPSLSSNAKPRHKLYSSGAHPSGAKTTVLYCRRVGCLSQYVAMSIWRLPTEMNRFMYRIVKSAAREKVTDVSCFFLVSVSTAHFPPTITTAWIAFSSRTTSSPPADSHSHHFITVFTTCSFP